MSFNYWVRIENSEEDLIFEGMIENVPSFHTLKTRIENRFYCCKYWIATQKPINLCDDCIIYRKEW